METLKCTQPSKLFAATRFPIKSHLGVAAAGRLSKIMKPMEMVRADILRLIAELRPPPKDEMIDFDNVARSQGFRHACFLVDDIQNCWATGK
jgi:hypothetical protein